MAREARRAARPPPIARRPERHRPAWYSSASARSRRRRRPRWSTTDQAGSRSTRRSCTPPSGLCALSRTMTSCACRRGHAPPIATTGATPQKRPLSAEYLKYGCINLDKRGEPDVPRGGRVDQAEILRVERTLHTRARSTQGDGRLIVCLNRATRLVKSQQGAGKVLTVCAYVERDSAADAAASCATRALFQRPPLISARGRPTPTIYANARRVRPGAQPRRLPRLVRGGHLIRTRATHLGLLLGVGGHMELRRSRRPAY